MPSTKVTASALAGALVVVLVWIVESVTSIPVPSYVAAAVTTIVSFGVGYMVPNK